MVKQGKARKNTNKKQKLKVLDGVASIRSTFNNTFITLSAPNGDTLLWESGGTAGCKGARKGTPYAAQLAAEAASAEALSRGMRRVQVLISGPGAGRETAVRTLQVAGLEITLLKDVTPVPHNGCRPPKKRRV